ncbi:MAG: DnaJ domain-containing protein [Candidatus Hydrogenedentota bacterium]
MMSTTIISPEIVEACQLLEISYPYNKKTLKNAYRNAVKQNHPDNNPYELSKECCERMIQITEAYHLLDKHLSQLAVVSKKPGAYNGKSILGQYYYEKDIFARTRYEAGGDEAYYYYKLGHIFYHSLHRVSPVRRPFQSAGSIGVKRKKSKKHIRLISIFERYTERYQDLTLAKEYYKEVVNNFPDSPWSWDAKYKLDLIKRRLETYKKILINYPKAKIKH